MEFTIEQNKRLAEVYPYLVPTNFWNDEPIKDYDYSYLRGEFELPKGWDRLFLMYCKNIKKYLVKEKLLNEFHFTQIKEKYGTMRLYNNLTTETISYLTILYEQFSEFICQECGNTATCQTCGWISSLCDNCAKDCSSYTEKLYSKKSCCICKHGKGGSYKMYFSYKHLQQEYNKIKKMTQEEFYCYLVD